MVLHSVHSRGGHHDRREPRADLQWAVDMGPQYQLVRRPDEGRERLLQPLPQGAGEFPRGLHGSAGVLRQEGHPPADDRRVVSRFPRRRAGGPRAAGHRSGERCEGAGGHRRQLLWRFLLGGRSPVEPGDVAREAPRVARRGARSAPSGHGRACTDWGWPAR